MCAMFKVARHPLDVFRQGPMRLVIGAALVVSIGAGGFAVGRATSDRQEVAVNGGSPSIGAAQPTHQTTGSQRTGPNGLSLAVVRDHGRHQPAQILVVAIPSEQAIKDCHIHRRSSC
jgi:hypothetical protein